MKKLLLVCCIVLGISTLSKAQGGGGRGMQMKPEDRVAAMKTSLALTDAQSAKILAIYQAQTKSLDSFRAAGSQDFTAMRPIMTAATAKVNAVLTPDQQAAFAKQQAAMRGGGGGRGGAGGAPATPPPFK